MPIQDLDSLLSNAEEPAGVSSIHADDSRVKVHPPHVFRAYKRRWYILLVYSFGGLFQGYLWNMWGPIYKTMQVAYGWDKTQLALMPFYGNSVLAVLALPSALLLERWGLRAIVLIMNFLTALGTIVRCIPAGQEGTKVLMNISALINGVPGIVTFFLPAFISARWFPLKERKFATAVGILLNTIGCAMAFIIGPLLVSDPPEKNPTSSDIERVRSDYRRYTYIETGLTVALFLLTLIYYPDKPPTPPSESADVGRIDYLEGCKRLLVSGEFWLLCVPITLLFGTYAGFWSPILPIDLGGHHIDQLQAGSVGFWMSIAGAIVGILSGKLGDYFGNLKAILLACCVLCAEGALWVALIMRGILPFSLTQTRIATIILGSAGSAMLPANCELASEMCFPVDEAIVVALLGVVSNIYTCALSIVLFFMTGTQWIDWYLAACCIGTIPFVLAIKEKYRRTNVDLGDTESDDGKGEKREENGVATVST